MSNNSENTYEIEIEEGHAKVPWFLKISFALLFASLFIYLVDYMVGAQPSSASIEDKNMNAPAPANPGEGTEEGTGTGESGN